MRLGSVLVLFAAVLATRPAHAESPVVVLTLPTQLSGNIPDRVGWQRAFNERMEGAVRRAGRTPRPSGPLTTAEAACRDATCLGRIAEAAQADIVLLGRVVADRGTPPSYKLQLLRYDRDRPGSVRQEEAECSVCTEVETAERLERMVTVMLPSLVVRPPRPPEGTPPVPSPAAAPPPKTVTVDQRSPGKAVWAAIGLTAVAGAGGLAMLAVGGKALSLDSDPVGSPMKAMGQTPELYDTRGLGIGLAVAGSVLLAGAAVGLALEIRTLKKAAR